MKFTIVTEAIANTIPPGELQDEIWFALEANEMIWIRTNEGPPQNTIVVFEIDRVGFATNGHGPACGV
jgi:hypothetical protein